MAKTGPAPKGKMSAAESDSQNAITDFSIPVRIIESPEDAERASERERQTQEHEAADLEAQLRAAKAAEDSARAAEWQILPTFWQVVFAGFATIGLIISLIINGIATRAAIRATGVAETIGFNESRPWISFLTVKFIPTRNTRIGDKIHNEALMFHAVLKNFGSSPANLTKVSTVFDIIIHNANEPSFDQDKFKDGSMSVPPGVTFWGEDGCIFGADLTNFKAGQTDLIVRATATYQTTFNRIERKTVGTFRCFVDGNTVENGMAETRYVIVPFGDQNTAT